jgi:hypothetical protein
MLTLVHMKLVVLIWALDFILKAHIMMINIDGFDLES